MFDCGCAMSTNDTATRFGQDTVCFYPSVPDRSDGDLVSLPALDLSQLWLFRGGPVFLRLLRLLKMFRYSKSLRVFANVVKGRREELAAAFSFTIFLLIFSSILMYFAEHQAQPEAFPNIPAALWWAVITLTTVGYGDVSPITPLGKLLGAVTALLGIGLLGIAFGHPRLLFRARVQ